MPDFYRETPDSPPLKPGARVFYVRLVGGKGAFIYDRDGTWDGIAGIQQRFGDRVVMITRVDRGVYPPYGPLINDGGTR